MSDKKKRRSRNEEQSVSVIKLIFVPIAFTGVYFLLVALFSLIAFKGELDSSFYAPLGIASGIISGFLCGYFSAKLVGHSGLLYGGLSGLAQGLLCGLLLSLVNSSGFGAGTMLLFFIIIIFSCIGGIIKANRKKRVRY